MTDDKPSYVDERLKQMAREVVRLVADQEMGCYYIEQMEKAALEWARRMLPPDHVVVPVEPTNDRLAALYDVVDCLLGIRLSDDEAYDIYKAMLQAQGVGDD